MLPIYLGKLSLVVLFRFLVFNDVQVPLAEGRTPNNNRENFVVADVAVRIKVSFYLPLGLFGLYLAKRQFPRQDEFFGFVGGHVDGVHKHVFFLHDSLCDDGLANHFILILATFLLIYIAFAFVLSILFEPPLAHVSLEHLDRLLWLRIENNLRPINNLR